VSEDERNFVLVTEVSDPIPTENAFDTDNDIIDVGEHQLEEQFRISFDVLVELGFAFLIYDADVHFAGMQIDTAIVFVLLIIKSHSLVSFHQIDNGLAVNQFYPDDVSEATGRGISGARMGR